MESRQVERGGFVHIIWDIATTPIPHDFSSVYTCQRVLQLAESYGLVGSFKCLYKHGSIETDLRRSLQESGVELEEIVTEKENGADVFILTRILRLTLSLQLNHIGPRPILMLLSSDRDFARALALVRRSGLFGEIVLIHPDNTADSLIHSSTIAVEWSTFLHGPPISRPREAFTIPAGAITPTGQQLSPFSGPAAVEQQMYSHIDEQVKPEEEAESSALQSVKGTQPGVRYIVIRPPPLYVAMPVLPNDGSTPRIAAQVGNQRSTPSISTALDEAATEASEHAKAEINAQHQHTSSGDKSISTSSTSGVLNKDFDFQNESRSMHGSNLSITPPTPSNADTIHPALPTTMVSSSTPASSSHLNSAAKPFQPMGLSFGTMSSPASTPSTLKSKRSGSIITATINNGSTAISSPVYQSPSVAARNLAAQTQSVLHVTAPRTPANVPMQSLSPVARSAIVAFHRVLQYCEQEKIIPRESVVKKRLLDSKVGADIDFEEWMKIVEDSGVAFIEGITPQRVVWPRQGDGPRKFACADFFQPTARLATEQYDELLNFLTTYKPEVDRGRFGFAQYLAKHGPKFIQLLPHGVLVELVQLLLNQKVLLFKKGKVSVAATIPTPEEREAFAATAGAVQSTPSASTTTTPQSSRPSSPQMTSSSNVSTPTTTSSSLSSTPQSSSHHVSTPHKNDPSQWGGTPQASASYQTAMKARRASLPQLGLSKDPSNPFNRNLVNVPSSISQPSSPSHSPIPSPTNMTSSSVGSLSSVNSSFIGNRVLNERMTKQSAIGRSSPIPSYRTVASSPLLGIDSPLHSPKAGKSRDNSPAPGKSNKQETIAEQVHSFFSKHENDTTTNEKSLNSTDVA